LSGKSIRVMQVLEATVGGTRRYLLDLVGKLPRDRFEQHVVVSVLRDPGFERDISMMQENGIQVSRLPMRRSIHPPSDWFCYRQLRQIIADWKPHVVHSHSSKAGFLARVAARGLGCANIYSPHCFAFQMRFGSLRQCFYRHLERVAGRYTDVLVLPCESQREVAVRAQVVPSERIAIVPTGVRASDYQSTCDRQHIRTAMGIDEQTSAIGVVAALSPQKGYRYLLEAMQKVLQNTEAVLLVAGSGVLQPALVAQAQKLGIADRVRWLGHREDVPELLHALDLFVLPSLWEGLPYALLEAMAAGVPIVATAIAGNVDLIDGHNTGWLAPVADAHGLSEVLLQPLAEPAETARRAAVAQKLVTEKYSLDAMIEHHVRLYRHYGSG